MDVKSGAATSPSDALSGAAAAHDAHRAALDLEADLLDERDEAIVGAIRAGARLDEIAEAASISRAAVSKAARRTLPSRTGRGGPYARRRGSSAALQRVSTATHRLAVARGRVRQTKHERDLIIATVIAGGAGVTDTARALGMTPAAISTIARSGAASVGP
jgi:hypothetical protein